MSDSPPPKTSFSIEEIEKIAGLAKLELTAEEKQMFAQQFGEILGYFRKLEAVDTSSVESSAQERARPVFREDKTEPSGISPADFSRYLEDGHFKVPRVIE